MLKVKCFDCGLEFEVEDNVFLREKVYKGIQIEMICDTCEKKSIETAATKKQEKSNKEKELRLKLFYEFVGERYKDADINKVDKKTFNCLANFERQFNRFNIRDKKNRGLVIFGDVGIGKTHLLFSIFKLLFVDNNINTIILRMNTLVRIHHALTFGNFPVGFEGIYYLNDIQGSLEYITVSDFVDILSNIPVLIIDEMSRLKASEFNLNFLIEVLDNRYSNCMVTIFCGNINAGDDLRKNLISIFGDAAIVDRILDKTWNDIFMISGENKRR